MSAIKLEDWLPAGTCGVTIKGTLLRDYDLITDLALLDQDLLEIVLPNGMKIDVGWFPENDPSGRFVVRVYRKYRTQPVRAPIEANRPIEVAATLANLVKQYCSPSAASETNPVSSPQLE